MTSEGEADFQTLRKETEYYKRRTDQLGGENLKLTITVSGLKHELTQKRRAFALLAELQQSIAPARDSAAIFEIIIRAIHASLGMDRTLVLLPEERQGWYRPAHWTGFHQDAVEGFPALAFDFSDAFAAGDGVLLVTKSTVATPLIEELRTAFGLPYFICLPLTVDGAPLGLLLSGRLKEARPYYPPLGQSDIDTLQAIGGLISTSVQRLRVEELEAASVRLKRFFSPQVADLIVSSGSERLLESHRREVTVAFCDLQGFTTFAESAEPEEVMGVLQEFHTAMGELIFRFDGTLDHFAGDGLLVFFNDPFPSPDPAGQAVRMAVAMRDRMAELEARWRKRGHDLGFGVGIAMGFANLGRIGFEGRFDYGVIGSVPNLASRLSDEARAGQILISQRVYAAVEAVVEVEPVGPLALKGFRTPVPVFNVVRLKKGAGPAER